MQTLQDRRLVVQKVIAVMPLVVKAIWLRELTFFKGIFSTLPLDEYYMWCWDKFAQRTRKEIFEGALKPCMCQRLDIARGAEVLAKAYGNLNYEATWSSTQLAAS